MHEARRIIIWIIVMLLTLLIVRRITAEEPRKPEPVGKNLKVLHSELTQLQLQRLMNSIRGGLGVHCDFCHVTNGQQWDWASDEKPTKLRAREMMKMVERINAETFGGEPRVTCYSCHRGERKPVSMDPLPQTPPPFPTPIVEAPKLPALDGVIARYLAALGDAKLLDAPKHLEGTREGFDGKAIPLTLLDDGHGRLFVEAKTDDGPLVQGYDGAKGWISQGKETHDMRPPELARMSENAKALELPRPSLFDAAAHVVASETIDGRAHWIVERPLDATRRERFAFDAENGQLRRKTLLWTTEVGVVPQQSDFTDYRDVGGIKLPFAVRVSFVDPWVGSVRKWSSIEIDRHIDPKRFDKP